MLRLLTLGIVSLLMFFAFGFDSSGFRYPALQNQTPLYYGYCTFNAPTVGGLTLLFHNWGVMLNNVAPGMDADFQFGGGDCLNFQVTEDVVFFGPIDDTGEVCPNPYSCTQLFFHPGPSVEIMTSMIRPGRLFNTLDADWQVALMYREMGFALGLDYHAEGNCAFEAGVGLRTIMGTVDDTPCNTFPEVFDGIGVACGVYGYDRPQLGDGDGDGFSGPVEVWVGTNPRDNCGSHRATPPIYSTSFPADVYSEFPSTNLITIQDITAYLVPIRRLGTDRGDPDYHPRWDIVPERGVLPWWINISDLVEIIIVQPPMFGTRAFGNPTPCIP